MPHRQLEPMREQKIHGTNMAHKYSPDDKRRFFDWVGRFLSMCKTAGVVIPEKLMYGSGTERLIGWIMKSLDKSENLTARTLSNSDLNELVRVLGEGYGFLDFFVGSTKRREADDRASNMLAKWIVHEKARMDYWCTMGPREFEIEVARLLDGNGISTEVTSYSADGGVDIWACYGGVLIPVQCKRYNSGKAGVGTVREMIGTMKVTGSLGGMIVCTNGFTLGARKLAAENEIVLWDMEEILNRALKSQ
jgi:HJR/Mrr/RecB family endonuclease